MRFVKRTYYCQDKRISNCSELTQILLTIRWDRLYIELTKMYLFQILINILSFFFFFLNKRFFFFIKRFIYLFIFLFYVAQHIM